MLIEGIDKIGLALFDELKANEMKHPEYMYYFNFLNIGIEIKKFSKCYKVICYNWNPSFHVIKEVYNFDFVSYKNDKWNRRYTIGEFTYLDDAKKCYLLCIKCFLNEKLGDLF